MQTIPHEGVCILHLHHHSLHAHVFHLLFHWQQLLEIMAISQLLMLVENSIPPVPHHWYILSSVQLMHSNIAATSLLPPQLFLQHLMKVEAYRQQGQLYKGNF